METESHYDGDVLHVRPTGLPPCGTYCVSCITVEASFHETPGGKLCCSCFERRAYDTIERLRASGS